MANVDPGASADDLTQRGRGRILGQIHADACGNHDRRLAGIETLAREPLPPVIARFEVDWNEPQPARNTETQLDRGGVASRPAEPGWSTSKTRRREAISGRR